MRPIKLTVRGLNSFIEEQSIDFTRLSSRGLFGVFGPTGSGKSTLLDGITLALYSKTARDSSDFINKNGDTTYVLFEFQIREQQTKHYRVERSFKRNDKGGINAKKPTRMIEILSDGQEVVLEDAPTKVDKKCSEVIGLKFEDFIRTVVLPQGKFSEFLQLEGTSKREMLERIFSLGQYGEGLSRKLLAVIRKEKSEMDQLQGELKAYEDVNQEILKNEEQVLAGITAQLSVKEEEVKKVSEEFIKSEEIFLLQQQRNKHEQSIAELTLEKEQIEEQKEKVIKGEKALKVKPYQEAFSNTSNQLEHFKAEFQHQNLFMNQLEEKYKQVGAEYEKEKQVKEVKVPALSLQIKQIEEAIEESLSKAQLEKERKHLLTDYIEKNKKRQSLIDERQAINEKLILWNKQIEDYEQEVKTLEVSPIYRENLQKARVTQIQLNHLLKQKQELVSEQEQLKKLINQTEQKRAKEKDLQDEILSQLDDLKKIKAQRMTALQQEVEAFKKKIEKMKQGQMVHALRTHIHKGDVCPVCNQQIMQEISWQHQQTESIQEQRQQEVLLAKKEEEYKQLERERLSIETLLENKQWVKQSENVNEEQNVSKLRAELEMLENEQIKKESILIEKGKRQEQLVQKLNELVEEQKNYQSVLNDFEKEFGSNEFEQKEIQIKKDELRKKELQEELIKIRNACKGEEEKIKSYQETIEALSSELAGIKVKGEEKRDYIEEKKKAIFKKVGECDDLEKYAKETKDDLQKLQEHFIQLEEEKKQVEQSYRELEKKVEVLKEQVKSFEQRKETDQKILLLHLEKQGFSSIEEMDKFSLSEEIIERFKKDIEAYTQKMHQLKGKLEEVTQKLKGREIKQEKWDHIQELKKRLEEEKSGLLSDQIEKRAVLTGLKQKIKEKEKLLLKEKQKEHKLSILKDLEGLFKGKKFVEFVAMHQLKYISYEASKRLKDITSGNYGLELDENGKFIIRDYKNGGSTRDASTLSGGETFLVSLSLALALSYHIQLKGNAPLELFFLDEGFGTLDEGLLDIVMNSIERLHHERLSVGIISHVESIKNRVPIRLTLTPSKSGVGGSRVNLENT